MDIGRHQETVRGDAMTSVKEAKGEFMLAQAADGGTAATIKWYTSILNALAISMGDVAIASITPKQLRQYIVELRERPDRYQNATQKPTQSGGLSESSIAGHIRALHAFWGWVSKEYDIANPMSNIKRPKPNQSLPKAISWEDFCKLYQAAGQTPTPQRDRAILALLMDTGCRIGGLVALKTSDLDIDNRLISVTEKGAKTRLLPISELTALAISQWLEIRSCEGNGLWAGLTVHGVQLLLQRLKKRAGVKGRANAHAFRHGFAKMYIAAGGDVATLAKLLGHSDVATTTQYLIFNVEDIKSSHNKYSPLANGLTKAID